MCDNLPPIRKLDILRIEMFIPGLFLLANLRLNFLNFYIYKNYRLWY